MGVINKDFWPEYTPLDQGHTRLIKYSSKLLGAKLGNYAVHCTSSAHFILLSLCFLTEFNLSGYNDQVKDSRYPIVSSTDVSLVINPKDSEFDTEEHKSKRKLQFQMNFKPSETFMTNDGQVRKFFRKF